MARMGRHRPGEGVRERSHGKGRAGVRDVTVQNGPRHDLRRETGGWRPEVVNAKRTRRRTMNEEENRKQTHAN